MTRELQKLFVFLYVSLMVALMLAGAAGFGVSMWVVVREIAAR